MSEETVFWDLNYAIKYKSLGTEEIQTKVLKVKKIFDYLNKLVLYGHNYLYTSLGGIL